MKQEIKSLVKESTTVSFTSLNIDKQLVKISDYPDGCTYDNCKT